MKAETGTRLVATFCTLSDPSRFEALLLRNVKNRTLVAAGKSAVILVPVAGVEPARVISPTDFESVTSANSITPAYLSKR